MSRIGITLIASLIASSALAAEPYEGRWGLNLIQCLSDESDAILIIDGNSLTGWEHSCRFTRKRKIGDATVINLKCDGEGETWTDTAAMRIVAINQLSTGIKGTSVMTRCPVLPKQARIDMLVRLWNDADDACRGSTGAKSDKGCADRTEIIQALYTHQWCYGLKTQISANMRWHKCTSQSNRP